MPIAVVDADSHLTEPGDTWCAGVGTQSQTGWTELPPSFPPTWAEINPACYDVERRLRWMDDHGVDVQVLYPNVVTFEGYAIKALADRDAQFAIFQAYNDYVHEFASQAPTRFVPVAAVPFWDVDATVAEITRCAQLGFSAIVWAATMERHGLPPIGDHHWDPVYERAQALEMSINFHVGVGSTADDIASFRELKDGAFDYGYWAGNSALAFMANSATITKLIMSGVCERFPRLNFVSVESGFGFIPYLVEALDWQWINIGAPAHHDNWLLPSEYFRRQIHCTFWFERESLSLLPSYADNVMFETDFPHSTALAPGGASLAPSPREVIERDAQLLDRSVLEKVLSTNARTLYRI